MPGWRPESSGPVCAVTAWRASTSRVTDGAGRAAPSGLGVSAGAVAASVTPADGIGGRRRRLRRAVRSRAVAELPVNLRPGGLDETVLDEEPADAQAALADALETPAAARRDALAAVVARWPGYLDGWARLGDVARDDVEAYAAYRVGYHRGLDRLRAAGWRGSGYVRWRHETNRGFLRSLAGLRRAAAALGETAEVERTTAFLTQLDPEWGGGGAEADQ